MHAVVRRRSARALVVGAFALLCAAGPLAGPAAGAGATVEVRPDGYAPAEVTIEVGDTVTWAWANPGHSVTHRPTEGQGRAFDSHPDCSPFFGVGCGQAGEEFRHTFETAGTYAYGSRMTEGITGTVVVEPAPAPTPSASPSPTRSTGPGESPSPAPEDTSEPATDDGPGSDDRDDAGSSASSRRAPSQQLSSSGRQSGAAPTPQVATATDHGSDAPTDPAGTPAADPTFDDFPEPSDVPTSSTDVPGAVAVGEGGGGGSRVVWGVLGSVTLLGTVGVFSRTVLFGDRWPGPS